MQIFLTSHLKEWVQKNWRQEEVELWSIAAEISAQTVASIEMQYPWEISLLKSISARPQ